MKRIVLNIFAFLTISVGAIAQIDINPASIVLQAEGIDEIYMDILITNNSTESIDLFWIYEPGQNYPESWKTQLCDINLCYLWDSFSSSPSLPNTLEAGQEVKFTIKVQNINEGLPITGNSYGILRLFDDPEKTNEVAATAGVTATVDFNNDDLVIYPNPTTEFFQLKNDANISSINIYNIVGRMVKTFNHQSGMVHDVTSLRTGMYLVRLENKEGEVVKSMRLSKK